MAKIIKPQSEDYFECPICGSVIYFCGGGYTAECIGAVCFGVESMHMYFGGSSLKQQQKHFDRWIRPSYYGKYGLRIHEGRLMEFKEGK